MLTRSSLFQTLSCALIALCLLATGCSSKQKGPITEQEVSALLERMDIATRNFDIEGRLACLSEHVQVKITARGGPIIPTRRFNNRVEYREYLQQGAHFIPGYSFKRGKTLVTIEPDGQTAFVADEFFETMVIHGEVINSVGTETATLKVENGQLVITSLEAEGRPLHPGETALLDKPQRGEE